MRRRAALIAVAIATIGGPAACSDDAGTGSTTTTTAASAPTGTVSLPDAGPDWEQFGHDLANSRFAADETLVTPDTVGDLTPTWSVDEVVGVTSTPTVVDGVAYFGDWTGSVHAVDPIDGTEVWTAELGGSVIGSVPVGADLVYAASGTTLYGLDRATGEVRWQATTNDTPLAMISASPVLADGLVFVGVASGEVTIPQPDYRFVGSLGAYDAETGEEVWRFETTTADEEAGAGVGIWSTPAVDTVRGVVYVGTGNTYEAPSAPLADSILALDVQTGELLWSTAFTAPDVFSAGNPTGPDADVGAAPMLWSVGDRDLVGAGDKAGVFHALDRDTGEVVWERTLTPGSAFGGVNGSSAYVDATLVVSSNIGDPATNAPLNTATVFALDAATGDERWQVDVDAMVFAPISTAPGLAFVGTTGGELLALDAATGERLWHRDAPNQVGAGPAIQDGVVLWGYGYALFDGPGAGGLQAFTVPGET